MLRSTLPRILKKLERNLQKDGLSQLDGLRADVGSGGSVTGDNVLRNLNVALLLVTGSLALASVVLDRRLDGVLGQHGAVQFNRWQAEFLCDFGVLDLSSLVERETLHSLCHVGRGSDRRTATERLEANVLDNTLLVDFDRELHDVSTGGSADETDTDVLVSLEEGANIAWVFVVVNDLFVVVATLGGGAKDGAASSCDDSRSGNSGESGSTRSRGNGLPCDGCDSVTKHCVCCVCELRYVCARR